MAKESKKKILYIITKSVWAGASKYVYDLAVALPKEEYSPIVVAGGRGVMAEKIISADIPYFEIKSFQRNVSFLKDIFAFFEILSLLFKIKPDVVHVSSPKAGGIVGVAFVFYKTAKKLAKPFFREGHSGESFETELPIPYPRAIFTVHGWTLNESRPKWQIILIKFFSKLTCLFYNKVICVSEYDYNVALKNKIAPAKKMTVIHNGIKPEDYDFLSREEARKALGDSVSKCYDHLETESPSEVWIGTIGEFTKNKGQRFLIDGIKDKFQISDFKFLIIGFGEEKKELELQIRDSESSNKVFLVDGLPDAAKYLKAFDIFVLPSLKEGLPYVLLEAGLARLPIVATDIGGVSEIIENEKTGILISPANSEEIANAIEKIMENPELRDKLDQNAREKTLREFSFKKMLDRTLNLYRE